MSETIKVIISKGMARVETEGFVGAACKDATAQLEKAMGKVVSDETTPEFDVKEARVVGN